MMVWAPTEDQFRHALAAELGSIEFIDESVGRILNSIQQLNLEDDTLIVFTSDHGDMFGDHGLILKHFTHYDAVIRVPLIMSGAGIGAGIHQELTSSADIAPTLVDLAGVGRMPRAQGRSLTSLMRGSDSHWREAVLVEEDQPYGLPNLPGPVRIRTVVTNGFRFTRVAGTSISELYDRGQDPLEMRNIAKDTHATELLADASACMVDELMRVVDDSQVPFRAA